MSDLQGFIQAETERQRFQVGAALISAVRKTGSGALYLEKGDL